MDLREKQLTRLFPKWNAPQHTGNWTADSKYFFFNTHDPVKDRDEDVWVLPKSGMRKHSVVQLTKRSTCLWMPVSQPRRQQIVCLGNSKPS
jgi:hypothetical protein